MKYQNPVRLKFESFQTPLSSPEECQVLCSNTTDCNWFSFNHPLSACFLFSSCPTLDETCLTCVSSSTKCNGKTSRNPFLHFKLRIFLSAAESQRPRQDFDRTSIKFSKYRELLFLFLFVKQSLWSFSVHLSFFLLRDTKLQLKIFTNF